MDISRGNTKQDINHDKAVRGMTHLHTLDELTRQSGDHLAEVQQRLLDRYQHVPADRIRQLIRIEADRLAEQPIQAFVPILVERAVRTHLDHDGSVGSAPSQVHLTRLES
jgi:hypothetical protein